MDLDATLRRALRTAGDGYRPSDLGPATERFTRRRDRRRARSWAGGAILAGAALVGAVAVVGALPGPRVAIEGGDDGPRVAEEAARDALASALPRGPISLADTHRVGPRPSDVEVADEALVVAHEEGRPASLVDARSGRRAGRLAEAPTALARGGDTVYGVDRVAGALYSFRPPEPDPVMARTVGPEPTDVAYGGGFVWVSSAAGRPDRYVVSQYAAGSFEPVGTYRVRYPARLEYAYGYLWAATHEGGLLRIDPDARTATRVAAVGGASDVGAGFGSVWVYELPERRFDAHVVRLDRGGGRVLDSVGVRGFFGRVEADEEAGVWVLSSVSEYERDLLRLRPVGGRDEPVRLEGGPFEMSAERGALWVVDGQRLKRFEVGR
ncbi:MAG TPA: hypothetical protein VHK89_02560 [Actinomycetota bacterium]|nr:hypothetical protein [Actinomycetota bacterium]